MCMGRSFKEIKGIVYHDANNEGIRGDSDTLLKGVGINLFLPANREVQSENGEKIKIYREKLIGRTVTNDKGEFRFIVNEAAYSVGLDMETLPAGKSVKETGRFIPARESGIIRIAVKDADSVNESRTRINNREPGLCSADRIKLAYRLGLIDGKQKVQYLAHALYQPSRLPKEYRSRVPSKSGTGIIEELNKYLNGRSTEQTVSDTIRQAMASSVPELDKLYRSPGGYFNIHYTLKGENAVDFNFRDPGGIPPYISQIAKAFDNVRAVTCFSRGYREPVLEEGKDAYDIYVFDLKNKYGVTYSSEIHSSLNARSRTASSYICIDNSYSKGKGFDKSRLECMKVTAAHEFFHAVQYAYNIDADTSWKEASATWNEDEVYTGINDYVRYIERYFKAPYQSLDGMSYSGVIFAKFLAQNYGGYDTIRRIWELQSAGEDNSIQAIDRFIRSNYTGKDIGSIYNQFATYNTNPAQYYKEGATWNLSAAAQNTYVKYPISANFGRLDHLASNYQMFRPVDPQQEKSLKIAIDGANGRWGFTLQKRNSKTKLYSSSEILSRGLYERAVIELEGFGTTFDEVWLIPANLETERNRMPYTYSADVSE